VLKFIDTKEQSDKSKWIEAVDVEHTRMVKNKEWIPVKKSGLEKG
jgi:hypothetical protein